MMESTSEAKTANEPETRNVYSLHNMRTKLIHTEDWMTSITSELSEPEVLLRMADKQLPEGSFPDCTSTFLTCPPGLKTVAEIEPPGDASSNGDVRSSLPSFTPAMSTAEEVSRCLFP
mmetsp:Transcript_16364/g.38896  ORF Transcript_16364/g.38896 Transcript_16364/m.38896 type:complete len:118 (+) Transcript_16364:915-1268(+)